MVIKKILWHFSWRFYGRHLNDTLLSGKWLSWLHTPTWEGRKSRHHCHTHFIIRNLRLGTVRWLASSHRNQCWCCWSENNTLSSKALYYPSQSFIFPGMWRYLNQAAKSMIRRRECYVKIQTCILIDGFIESNYLWKHFYSHISCLFSKKGLVLTFWLIQKQF